MSRSPEVSPETKERPSPSARGNCTGTQPDGAMKTGSTIAPLYHESVSLRVLCRIGPKAFALFYNLERMEREHSSPFFMDPLYDGNPGALPVHCVARVGGWKAPAPYPRDFFGFHANDHGYARCDSIGRTTVVTATMQAIKTGPVAPRRRVGTRRSAAASGCRGIPGACGAG
jgi:hypothetical protein